MRVPPRSMAARSVYVTSTNPDAQVPVEVFEIAAPGAPEPLPGGLASRTLINPDVENPDVENPDVENPDVENPDVENAEVYNPDVENPDVENPDVENPDVENPDVENPDVENVVVANPDIDNVNIGNPDVENPDVENPDVENPDVENPDVENGAIADITWEVKNTGNTTAAFNVNLFLANANIPQGLQTQLVIYKAYKTPVTVPNGCELRFETRNVLVTNIPAPNFVSPTGGTLPDPNDPSEKNPTLWLAPSEVGRITLRIVDNDTSNNVFIRNANGELVSIDPVFNPEENDVTPGISSQAVDTEDAEAGVTDPPIVTPTGSNLFFLQQPTTTAVNATVTPPVRVRVIDNSGASVPGLTVTLSLNVPGVVLTGNVATTDETGVATFGALQINTPGVGYILTASVGGTVPASAQSSAFDIVSPTLDADLVVTQSSTQPVINQNTTYTLTVTNNGPAVATGIVLVDTLPAAVDFILVSDESCTYNPDLRTVTCPVGTLQPGVSRAYGIVVQPTEIGTLLNTVTVGSTQGDPVPANNTATDTTFVSAFPFCASPSFAGPRLSDFGQSTSSNPMTLGDFDEDGESDLAVVTLRSAVTRVIAILLGDGAGGFTLSSDVPISGTPQRIVAGDFDEDGHLDLALTVQSIPSVGAAVQILQGDGDGGFTPVTTVPLAGLPLEITAVDINGDEHLDLFAGNFASGTGISLLLGDGDGAFSVSTLGVSTDDVIALADFDADGDLDLAAPAQDLQSINILQGDGEGGFTPFAIIPFSDLVMSIRAVADLNGDNRAELAVTTSAAGDPLARLLLLTTDGGGGFNAPVELLPPSLARSSSVLSDGDVNGDGRVDLIAIAQPTSSILVLLNNGGGGFAPPVSYLTSVPPSRVLVSDVSGDSRPDLVISARQQGTIAVLLNTCSLGTSADLEVSKSGPTTATAGDTITYTVTVTNNGPDTATGVVVTDAFAAGMTYVGENSCTPSGSTLTCTTEAITSGGSVSFNVEVRVVGAGSKINRAMATAQQSDPNASNNIGTATTAVAAASLTFTANNTNDSGPGSLRQAILDANANAGATNTINFNLDGTGPFTIAPLSALPPITVPVVIDGTTQTGYSGAPLIELMGANTSGAGLTIVGGNSIVRGLAINRWSGNGITLASNGNRVEANYVGTDPSGMISRPNGNAGVQVSFGAWSNNVIGGLTPAQRNLISGGGGNGVSLRQGATNNLVQGNYIGVNAQGTAALGNTGAGVIIGESSNNTVTDNVLSGNGLDGVLFVSEFPPNVAIGNVIRANRIGTDASGTVAIGNLQAGVHFASTAASANVIGGVAPGDGNLIAFNTGIGVRVVGTNNAVRGNAIHTNGGLGIDLGANGVTANDAGDADTGANNLQNFPVITAAGTGSTIIDGTISSTPNTLFALDFFASSSCDPTGFGEGQRFLGSATVNTNETGLGSYHVTLTPTAVTGEFITATATDPAGNTSEFSSCVQVGGATTADLAVTQVRTPEVAVINTPVTYTVTVTNNGPTLANGVVLTDTLPAGVNFVSVTGTGCQEATGIVTCAIGALGSGATSVVTIVVTPVEAAPITNVATVSSSGIDPVGGNNTASDTTFVSSYAPCSSPTFLGPFVHALNTQSTGIMATADFNEDTFPDLVIAEGDGNYVLLISNGLGGFSEPVYFEETFPTAITTADFNSDGHADVAAINQNNPGNPNPAEFGVGLGDGTGNFPESGQEDIHLPLAGTFNVVAADFNNDGHPDVAVSSANTADNTIVVMLGVGDGSFNPPVSVPAGPTPGNLVVGDYNMDGNLDIAVNNIGFPTVSILRGDGEGGFSPQTVTLPVATGRLRKLNDVNGDGAPDLGVTTGTPLNLVLLLNDGTGNFLPPTEIIGPRGIGHTTTGDFNGDGTPDLAAISFQENRLLILDGDGQGHFTESASYLTGTSQNNFVVTDLNADGRPDIAGTVRGGYYMLLNTCAGDQGASADLDSTVTGPETGAVGDQLTYSAFIANQGPDPATNVVATFVVPSGMSFVSSTADCVESYGTVQCNMPTIAPDGTESFTVTVQARASGLRVTQLMATATEPDPDASNNIGGANTNISGGSFNFVVTSTADAGRGTLREAISDSNLNAGSINQIHFNITTGAAPFTIAPLSGLPGINVPVVIDGTTQPGYAGTPIIELTGIDTSNSNGLNINAGSSTVRGLSITRWFFNGINLNANGNNVVEGNFIGVTPAGIAAGNATGVNVVSPNNRIGGTTPSARNVISANGGNNVNVGATVVNGALGTTGSGTVVVGNYIGTNPAGTAAMTGNGVGVRVSVPNVTVGTPQAPNVISGNGGSGVSANAQTPATGSTVVLATPTNLLVQSNFIGTNAAGSAAIANNNGVVLNSGNGRIGGTSAGEGNLISGNTNSGISLGHNNTGGATPQFVSQSSGYVVEGNTIGLNQAGTAAIPNTTSGIFIGTPNHTIGGLTASARNIIAGNNGNGINLNVPTPPFTVPSNNTVIGNYVGLNASGVAIGNGGAGVTINGTGTTNNTIGGVSPGAGNVISGNGPTAAANGININIGTASNIIQGNRIGTNPAGTAAIPNSGSGISISSSNANVIGGAAAGARNLISGNGTGTNFAPGVNVSGYERQQRHRRKLHRH